MGEPDTRTTQAKRKALRRHKALWDQYKTKGILMLADVERLTGVKYQTVTDTFETYGLEVPPVYNSRKEKYKRQAKRLRDEAARLGQKSLTISQAAKVLNTKKGRIVGIEGRLLRAGCTLPDIVMDEGKPPVPYQESREYTEFAGRINGVCNPLYYPDGLPVAKYWPGPGKNEVTYLIR
jgi:hypothetical protein